MACILCLVLSIFLHFRFRWIVSLGNFILFSYLPFWVGTMNFVSIQTKSCVTKANEKNEFSYPSNVMYVVKSCFYCLHGDNGKTMPEKLCYHSLIHVSGCVTFLFCSFDGKILLLSHFVECWMLCKCPLWMHFKLIVYIRAEMNESKESALKYTVMIFSVRWTWFCICSPFQNSLSITMCVRMEQITQ